MNYLLISQDSSVLKLSFFVSLIAWVKSKFKTIENRHCLEVTSLDNNSHVINSRVPPTNNVILDHANYVICVSGILILVVSVNQVSKFESKCKKCLKLLSKQFRKGNVHDSHYL